MDDVKDERELEDGIVTHAAGDLMDAMLRQVKSQDKPYALMKESEQRELLDRIRRNVSDAVRRSVHSIAAAGRVTVQASLDKVVFGKGIQATLTIAPHDAARLALADSRGKLCVIVVADPGEHMGGLGDHKPEPDQRKIA